MTTPVQPPQVRMKRQSAFASRCSPHCRDFHFATWLYSMVYVSCSGGASKLQAEDDPDR